MVTSGGSGGESNDVSVYLDDDGAEDMDPTDEDSPPQESSRRNENSSYTKEGYSEH